MFRSYSTAPLQAFYVVDDTVFSTLRGARNLITTAINRLVKSEHLSRAEFKTRFRLQSVVFGSVFPDAVQFDADNTP